MDAATNLIYVGNGQYYDPSTGRFLTRNANPNSPNPYVPWNPIGAVVGPLALFTMIASRRKGRNSKATPYLFMLLLLVVLPLSIGMACGSSSSTPAAPTQEPTQPPATGTPTPSETPSPTPTEPPPPTETPTLPCTPTPTLSADQELRDVYGVILINGNITWSSAQIDVIRTAIRDIANRFGSASAFRVKFNVSDSSPIRMVRGTNTSYVPEIIAGECTTINAGGCTSPNKTINFASLWPNGGRLETARNNVVHEMGHVFNNEHGNVPVAELEAHPEDFVDNRNGILQNNDTIQWQLNTSFTANETFGDFFVAWTYNEWRPLFDQYGHPTIASTAKSWMDAKMQDW